MTGNVGMSRIALSICSHVDRPLRKGSHVEITLRASRVGVVRIKPPPQAGSVEYVVAGDPVDGVSSNYLDQADGALLWVGRVEDVATQVANLVSDSRR